MEKIADFNLPWMSKLECNPKTWISEYEIAEKQEKCCKKTKMMMKDVSQTNT